MMESRVRSLNQLFSLLAVGLSVFVFTNGESSVWKVQSGESVTYLGGTCHVLRTSDYPLPVEFSSAYDVSDVLVFETDFDELNSPKTQQAILRQGALGGGKTLENILSPETYRTLSGYCEKTGIPVLALNRLKPPLAVLTLLGVELQRLGVNQSGVDSHFHGKGKADGKEIQWLEEVQQQIDFIFSMGRGDEESFVKLSLKDLEKTEEILSELIAAWKQGDEETLTRIMVEDMKRDYPELYESLLAERNRQWMPAIERYLHTPETELILVGVGHLVGVDGVVQLLIGKGYPVSKVR